ncbi:hypothetical protein [Pseudescherichia sp.]|uniref:hypothetical protein n=1 Tax=Pseudescherichia sp. TaxID=2055881 RepID=UPI00289701D3|nr:hypothetical protein [Pseudescherichia sp.]
MSWDNVKGVSSAKIWTDNPNLSQAYLFANGNHQVKVTVGLSLTLTNISQGGPTADEVKAALSLVDYETGVALSYLKTGSKGSYGSVYLPNLPMANNAVTASSDIAYQYEFDYYLSSDSTINPSYGSEKVALLLSYTDSSGTKVEYSTASGNKSQSSVAVTVYPPKRYGMSDGNTMPIIFNIVDDQPNFQLLSENTVVIDYYPQEMTVYGLRIDDPYFRLTQFEPVSTPESPTAFLQYRINDQSNPNQYLYYVAHSFLLSENNLTTTGTNYTAKCSFVTNQNYFLLQYGVSVHQQCGQIMFVRIQTGIQYDNVNVHVGPIADSGGQANFTVFDQFGNSASVDVVKDGDGYLKLSSVN